MESVEYLEKRLTYARRIRKIENEINTKKCPLCGGSLKYDIEEPQGYDSNAYGILYCEKCGLVRNEITLNSQDSYNWYFDGSSYLELLTRLWNKLQFLNK